jgi:hypothetical protein
MALAYQTQVELIMSAPRYDPRKDARRRETLGMAAVVLAIAVSLCGACIVIVQAAAEPPPRHASAAE